jgi:hypothetical protein
MDGVIARMEALGATVVRFELPEYDRLLPVIATDLYEARTVTEKYFATLPSNSPIRATARSWRQTLRCAEDAGSRICHCRWHEQLEYKNRMLNRDKLRLAVVNKMAELNLDAILYPHQKILVVPVTAAEQSERNGPLSNGTAFRRSHFRRDSPHPPPRHPWAFQ